MNTRIMEMAIPETELTPAELEVLKALWTEGPSTVRDVLTHLEARGRDLAYTTVLTFLTRLEQKGVVRSDRSGQAYVYAPKVTQEKVRRSRLRAFVEELYDGAAGPLVLQLIRERSLTKGEIAELQTLIEDLDQKRPAPRKRGRN